MNRIDQRFSKLKAARRTGLVPFFTAGDPSPDAVVAIMHALVEAGADLIELGVPFSDPMADGPVIQHASERALARGVGLTRIFEWVREFRTRDADTPVVLMGYMRVAFGLGEQARGVSAQDLTAIGRARAQGVEALVVPAQEGVLGGAVECRRVQLDVLALTDAVETTDALLQQVGIERQIP